MKRLTSYVLLCVLSTSVLLMGLTRPVEAAFNKDLLMDDPLFNSVSTVHAGQVDAMLNARGSCISPNSGFSAIDPIGYSPSGGYQYGGNVSAGTVIAHAAQAYDLNPQVLLVMLQKEQSLVTATSCTTSTIAKAASYSCNGSGAKFSYSGLNLYTRNGATYADVVDTCVNTAAKTGFSQQVIRAAWLLKFTQQRSMGNVDWAIVRGSWNNSDDLGSCYSGMMTAGFRKRCASDPAPTYYDGYTTISGTSVYVGSGATAALYRYNPEMSGNQLFVSIFEGWFGSTLSCESPHSSATTPGTYQSGYFYQRNCHSPGWASATIQFGNSNWVPLSGDWNNDGVFTPGAYDPGTGRFYLRNTNDGGGADTAFQYGNIGWIPLAGDWDGNGYWSIGLYDPNTSIFYLKNFNGGGGADYAAPFGNGGWKPVVGDWNSDRATTIGVYNPSTAVFYLNDQHDGSAAERTLLYGNAGWTPLAGDWDGNGYWSIGAYNPSSATFYMRNMNDGGPADITMQYGNAGWLPIVGDWDGHR